MCKINNPEYGLSYLRNQNLDMRLDRTDDSIPNASQILQWSPEKSLEDIFYQVIKYNLYC